MTGANLPTRSSSAATPLTGSVPKTMPSHILYAYVEGSDLMGIAEELNARFLKFIESRTWTAGEIWHVDQRQSCDGVSNPEDIPEWELGLNLRLPSPGSEPAGWYSDVVAIAQFLGNLHDDTGRDFVIGIYDEETTVSDDLFFVDCSEPDLDGLRSIIGTGDLE